MNHLAASSHQSWLSLVAETAGVAGTGIARVQLGSFDWSGPVRAVVQVLDLTHQVVGAAYWYGEGSDLEAGVSLDLGYDVYFQGDVRLVAWVDTELSARPARHAQAPEFATRMTYDPTRVHRMMLPSRSALPSRSLSQSRSPSQRGRLSQRGTAQPRKTHTKLVPEAA